MKAILLIIFTVLLSIVSEASFGDVKLKIRNIRSNKGTILISIYNKAAQFPLKPFKVIKVKKSNMRNGELNFTIKGLKNQQYAISLLDDENQNSDMDYTWIGIPKEGYSFSNNARPKGMSAPSYSDAMFELNEKGREILFSFEYW